MVEVNSGGFDLRAPILDDRGRSAFAQFNDQLQIEVTGGCFKLNVNGFFKLFSGWNAEFVALPFFFITLCQDEILFIEVLDVERY